MIRVFHVGGEAKFGTPGCHTEALLRELYSTALEKGLNPKGVLNAFRWRNDKPRDPTAPIILDYAGSPYIFFAKTTTRYKPILWTQIEGQTGQGEAISTSREVWVVDERPEETLRQAREERRTWMVEQLERQKRGVNFLVVSEQAWRWWNRGGNRRIWSPLLKSFDMISDTYDRELEEKKAALEKLSKEVVERSDQVERIRNRHGDEILAVQAEARAATAEASALREKLAALEAQLSSRKGKAATP